MGVAIISVGKKKYGGAKAFEMYAIAAQKPEQLTVLDSDGWHLA